MQVQGEMLKAQPGLAQRRRDAEGKRKNVEVKGVFPAEALRR